MIGRPFGLGRGHHDDRLPDNGTPLLRPLIAQPPCIFCFRLLSFLTPPKMKNEKALSPEKLKDRAIRFFDRYGADLEQIRSLLQIRLEQLALAYTIEEKLPPEAIVVSSRVKSLSSFLKKLKKKNWPQFYYPSHVVSDLIGARVVCWFGDDCHGYLTLLQQSKHLTLDADIKDYISNPKPSGYRSIHAVANVSYDRVRRVNGSVEIDEDEMSCEVQIRTKLQDAWGDLTHEFHYKANDAGVRNNFYEDLLSDVAGRLENEDRTLMKFRDAYLGLAEEKLAKGEREGFRDD